MEALTLKRKKRRTNINLKVCIIDESKDFRKNLKANLEKDKRIRVITSESSGLSLLKKCNSTFKADVVIIDNELQDIPGIDCAQEIIKKKPNTHIILMTNSPESIGFANARKIGAEYIDKNAKIKSLLQHLISIVEEKGKESIYSVVNEEPIEQEYLDLAHEVYSARQRMLDLSDSQIHVLKLRKEGKSLNEIADILGVAPGTVHTHISRALKKLQLPDMLDYIID